MCVQQCKLTIVIVALMCVGAVALSPRASVPVMKLWTLIWYAWVVLGEHTFRVRQPDCGS